MSSLQSLTLVRPDDWHLHLRDGPALAAVVQATARVFARAIVMPNLKPPVTTVTAARAYRDRIVQALPPALAARSLRRPAWVRHDEDLHLDFARVASR